MQQNDGEKESVACQQTERRQTRRALRPPERHSPGDVIPQVLHPSNSSWPIRQSLEPLGGYAGLAYRTADNPPNDGACCICVATTSDNVNDAPADIALIS